MTATFNKIMLSTTKQWEVKLPVEYSKKNGGDMRRHKACSRGGSGGFVRVVSENKTSECFHQ
jgi:hypothetical protein